LPTADDGISALPQVWQAVGKVKKGCVERRSELEVNFVWLIIAEFVPGSNDVIEEVGAVF